MHLLDANKYNKKHIDAPTCTHRISSAVTAVAWNPTDDRYIAFGTVQGSVRYFII